jgi:hypothetical protein
VSLSRVPAMRTIKTVEFYSIKSVGVIWKQTASVASGMGNAKNYCQAFLRLTNASVNSPAIIMSAMTA